MHVNAKGLTSLHNSEVFCSYLKCQNEGQNLDILHLLLTYQLCVCGGVGNDPETAWAYTEDTERT